MTTHSSSDVSIPIKGEALIDGSWHRSETQIEIRNPFDNSLVGTVPSCTQDMALRAIDAAAAAARKNMPLHQRVDILMRAAEFVDRHQEEYASILAHEGSKTIREARREPPRAATILRLSAEAGRRLTGETLPFDSRVGSENRVGYYFRFPAGIVSAILPFNDPLALAAHVIGPAFAAGNPIIVKPSARTPLSILRLARHLTDAGIPPGWLNIVTGKGAAIGDALVGDPRIRIVTFTGGVRTGQAIARKAGIKKLIMELGSNSPVIVMDDASIDRAVPLIASGAFAQAGENCLGVQRVLIHEKIYDRFKERFVKHVNTLKAGSSLDEATDVCAMITEAEAERVHAWIKEAVDKGAHILTGGKKEGAVLRPTVLEKVPRGIQIDCEEVYGPVVSLYRITSLDEAIEQANDVEYGLHAAIFTERLTDAFAAARKLHFGGIIVNDSTDYRLDVMPFGGTKMSGIGRQGVWTMLEEMTETRVVCFNL